MSALRLASRYAKSLLDLATQKGELDSTYGDIMVLKDALTSNRDFWLLLKSPIVTTDKKVSIIKAAFGETFNAITTGFIDIVTRKRRESYLPEIVDAFIQEYQNRNGVVKAKLTTATAVTQSLLDKVNEIVLKNTGKKTVAIETEVDSSLIGGFILQFEDKLFDSTISHKLDKLKKGFEKNKYVREF